MNDSLVLQTPYPISPQNTFKLALLHLRQQMEEMAPLDDKEWALLESKIKWEPRMKGDLLLKPGQICSHVRFLQQGAVIHYEHMDEDIQLEQVGWIAQPTELVVEINSFFQQLPTLVHLKCTVPCNFLTLRYEDLQALYAESPAWNTIGRRLAEAYMVLMAERTYFHQLNSAKAKYQYFTERFPDALQLVSQRHIAAFLRIRPETLSRLRRAKMT